MIPVVGVLTSNSAEEVAGIVAHFRPDEVPILPHHHAGVMVGFVRGVVADGTNIWFVGLVEDPATEECVRRGPVAVSLEMFGNGVVPRADTPGGVLPFDLPSPFFHGRRDTFGWTLEAIALMRDGDPPGAKGSALWEFVR